MDLETLICYVIIVLIFVMLVKIFTKSPTKKEPMILFPNDNKITVDDFMVKDSFDQTEPNILVGKSNIYPNLSPCVSCVSNNTYTKEFMSPDNEFCSEPPKLYSERDLQKYRNDFIDFRNKIWQMDGTPDAVDRINNMPTMEEGQLIKNVYDQITKESI